MATRDLDRIDRKILETLQLDGRITNQELSDRIALSPRACLERVRRLERAGVISGYMALIEPRKLGGVLTVVVEVTLRDQKQATHARFEQRARATDTSLSEAAKALIQRGLAAEEPPRKLGTELFELVPPEYRVDLDCDMPDVANDPPDFS
jgi:DNA-binding Lrp family transcriptional regulator